MGNSVSSRSSSRPVLTSPDQEIIEPHRHNVSATEAHRDPESQRLGNRVLAHITQERMLFGPFFQLADSENDLVPFAQLMETDESSNGLVDRVLQMLLDDGQTGAGSGVADVLPVDVLEGSLNVLNDSFHLRKSTVEGSLGAGFNLTATVLSRSVGKWQLTVFINGSTEVGSCNIVDPEQSISIFISQESLNQLLELQTSQEPTEPPKTVMTLVMTATVANQPPQKLTVGLEVFEHETTPAEKVYTLEIIYKKYEINGQTFMLQDIYGFVDTVSTSPSPLTIRQDAEVSQRPSSSASSVTGTAKPSQSKIDYASLSVADCVICMSEPKCVMALPCRHMCLCRDCADIIRQQQHGKCPICRQPFYSLLQISRTLPSTDTAIIMPST